MKILVCVKRVLDPQVKARVKADGSGVDLANAKMTMNPFDENALEEARHMFAEYTIDSVCRELRQGALTLEVQPKVLDLLRKKTSRTRIARVPPTKRFWRTSPMAL